jgi:hypothetical protein
MQITILAIDLQDQDTINIEVYINHENSATIKNLSFPAEWIHECLLDDHPNVLETMIAETVLDMIGLQRTLNVYKGRVIEVDVNSEVVAVTA